MRFTLKDSLWKYGLFVVLILLLWGLFQPLVNRAGLSAYRASCQSNLKRIGLAMMQYTQDYDERFALVNVNDAAISAQQPLGWADAVQPYLKSLEVFHCPLEKLQDTNEKPNGLNYTDYWYNARLNGVYIGRIEQKQSVLLFGEGNDGTDASNARYSLNSLPSSWRKDEESPARRHLDGANYAFADGHVKWFKPSQITDKKPSRKNYTFALK